MWLTDGWGSVYAPISGGDIVFRAAHDSSKAMKAWMGELRGKKK